jgi:type I restriction enzyme M protein
MVKDRGASLIGKRIRRVQAAARLKINARVPPEAARVPPTAPEAKEGSKLDGRIQAKLKAGPEQSDVVGPIVRLLLAKGWELDQIRFGKEEWRVPKTPSEATRREKHQAFNGFPCDIAVFDSPKRRDDPHHLLMIIETKVPDETAGVSELERYISLEPYVRVGIWTNTADPTTDAVFAYRSANGGFERRRRPLADIPAPGEPINAARRRRTFEDLIAPSPESLKKNVEDLLDRIVIEDSRVTRREDQLDQLCNLLLLKLHSDKLAKIKPGDPPLFRAFESETRTAEQMRREFTKLVNLYPNTFTTQQDKELRFSDHTIHICVERLAEYRLIDIGVTTVALAFQVLRTAALKAGEGQYFTPMPVIQAGVRLLTVELDDLVIDPACGTGGFLVDVVLQMHARFPGMESDLSKWAQTNIYRIDKDAIGVKLTKAILQVAGDGSAHVVRGDSIRTHLWSTEYPYLMGGAFSNGRFSVVVTNPPFGTNLRVSAQDARLAGLDIAKDTKGEYRDLEIGLHFLQRAHQLLRVGGRLGIVLPETYFFSAQYQFVFDWIKPRLHPRIVANIPMEAFQGFCRAKTNFYVFEKIG